ncbi:hypothetical protein HOO14_06185 [bacterium]|jgi:hypothetical protein|nr:hypothetical protein [bacterium]
MSKNDKKLDSKAQGEKQHLVDEHLENNINEELEGELIFLLKDIYAKYGNLHSISSHVSSGEVFINYRYNRPTDEWVSYSFGL